MTPTLVANNELITPLPDKTTLDIYLEEMKVDTDLNEFTVKDVQLKLPGLKHKWVGRLIRTKVALQRLQRDKELLKKTLSEQLRKESVVAMSVPNAERAVETHSRVIAITEKIQEHLLLVEFLERVEKIFSSMTFDIKNLVEIMKLETL